MLGFCVLLFALSFSVRAARSSRSFDLCSEDKSMYAHKVRPRRLVANRHHTICIDDRVPEDRGGIYAWGGGEAAPPVQDQDGDGEAGTALMIKPLVSAGKDTTRRDGKAAMTLHHLGLGENEPSIGPAVPRPRRIAGLEGVRIVELAAGLEHTLMRSHGGAVYSCGKGFSGQLGHGDETSISTPRRIEPLLHGGLQLEHHGLAEMISAGHDHSLVLTKTGLVYSFGSGINGRHGHGETTNQWHPKPIKSLEREFIRFIEAGASHSFAVNRQGELFAWGLGGSGQLGLGPCEPTYQRIKPTKVEYFTFEHIEVKQVSAGAAHTLVVDTDGKLYSFGFGTYGRLGHGDREDVFVPKRVEGALAGVEVKYALAGLEHSVVLTESSQVYTFGSDARGKLGHGHKTSMALPRGVRNYLDENYGPSSEAERRVQQAYAFGPNRSKDFGDSRDIAIGHGQDFSVSLPTRVEALLTEEIVDVAVGDYHTVVMIGRGKDGTWSGELRAFGCNDDGQLGLPWLADEGDKQLPAVVEWPPERAPEDQVAPAEVQAEAEQKAEDIYESDEDKPDEDAYVLAARLGGGSALVAKQAAKEAKEMSAAERMLAKAMEVEAAEEERIANEKARIANEKALKGEKEPEPETPKKPEIELPPPPPKGWYPVSKN